MSRIDLHLLEAEVNTFIFDYEKRYRFASFQCPKTDFLCKGFDKQEKKWSVGSVNNNVQNYCFTKLTCA